MNLIPWPHIPSLYFFVYERVCVCVDIGRLILEGFHFFISFSSFFMSSSYSFSLLHFSSYFIYES